VKYLKIDSGITGAECSGDAVRATAPQEAHLAELQRELTQTPPGELASRLRLMLDSGYLLLDLERPAEAATSAREAFNLAVPAQLWEEAVQACDILFQAEEADAVAALAHGIWLAVTYPVDPELSVAMLRHLIDETPPRSDGAAVAAASARYIVDLRAEGKQREDLLFFTAQMLGEVARRHSQVDEQEVFDFWVEHLELNDPAKFLPRLSQVIDTLIEEPWWFDRDALRAKLPAE